jgi:signal transduction histidine kinase
MLPRERDHRNDMKRRPTKLAEQYLAALRLHLKSGFPTRGQRSLPTAVKLGHLAVALQLETLDVARIHTQALKTLLARGGSSLTRSKLIQRAKIFFAEAITPIEKTHRAALAAENQANQLNQSLRQRTAESSTSVRHLNRDIVQRQVTEEALDKSKKQYVTLLEKSRRLQKHLRQLTYEILSTQEDDRRKISRQLQDEIAQTLLGINVRLLTLKNATRTNTETLQKEIDNTQRLGAQSVKTIRRFAHEFGSSNET